MTKINGTAGRLKGIIVLLLLFGPASFLIFISSRGCEHKFVELDDMGKVPNYNFVNGDGVKMNQSSFKDKVVLFTTLQVTCPNKCAVSFWHLDQLIYQHLRKNKKKLGHVKLVSFVTDGKGKPYSNLNEIEYMLKDQVEKYDSSVWILANGDAKSLYNISRNGENLLVKGNKYFGGEAFQELMLLVDKRNHLRMVLKGNSEGMIRKMKEHIALLDKQYDKEALKNK
jgi:cytochrome oxidase Cu insertion factor (SCO1/SenC/PrrC family)